MCYNFKKLVEKFLDPAPAGNNKKLHSDFLDKIISCEYIVGCFREDLPKYSIPFSSKRPNYTKAKSNRNKEFFIVIALGNNKFQIMNDDIFDVLTKNYYVYCDHNFSEFRYHVVDLEFNGEWNLSRKPIIWHIISEDDNPIDIIIDESLSLNLALMHFHEGKTIFRKKWKEEGNDKELKEGPVNDFYLQLEDIEAKDWCVKKQVKQKSNDCKLLVDFIQASKYLKDGKKIYSSALEEYGIKYLKIIELVSSNKADNDVGHTEQFRFIGAYSHGEIYKWNEREFFEKHSLTDEIWYTEN